MKKTLLLFLLLPFFGFAQEVELLKWNAAVIATPFKPVANTGITIQDLNVTSGQAPSYIDGWDATPFFMTGGWPNPQQNEGGYDSAKYIEFKIAPTANYKADLTTFSFTYRTQGNTEKFQIQYSKDNAFKTNVKTLVSETIATTTWATVNPTFSEINPVLAGETVYVRVYVYGSTDNFHIRAANGTNPSPATVKGKISSFDANKILAINDYVKTIKNVGINIAPLSNDVKKENVNSIIISSPLLASQGTVIINPDKTMTFNPAKDFTGKATFKYRISNSTDPSSEATIEVNVTDDLPEALVIWDGKDSANRYNPSVFSPYVSSDRINNLGGVSLSYKNDEDSSNPFYITGNWPSANNSNDTSKYIEFKISADLKHKVDLTTFGFTFRNQDTNSGNGKQQKFKIDYSKSSTFANGVKTLVPVTVSSGSWTTINPDFASDLNSLSPGETIYFRLYVYNTNDNFQFRTRTNIKGSVKDTNTLLANDDYVDSPANQPATVLILGNDVLGDSALQAITVTQPSKGTVTVNGLNSVTFTPASNFTGTDSFTYTIRNANSSYSSATVFINGTAPTCTATPTPGVNFWKGYVYTYTGTPAADTYVGSVVENPVFDRNVGDGAITGEISRAANVFCGAAPSDKFFVKYLMDADVPAGTYNFTIGGDDGVRLYIDGNLITTSPTNSWGTHAYTAYAVQVTLTAGIHHFVLEYYENLEASRVSFMYGQVQTTATYPYGINKWNVYGFTLPDTTYPAASYAGTYVDTNTSIDTQAYWNKTKSPSYAANWQGAPMGVDQFAIVYKRQGFPCGNYKLELVNSDDYAEIYIDGVLIHTQSGYTTARTPINGTYVLNKDSKVDVRLREDGADANIAIDFINLAIEYKETDPLPTNTPALIISGNATLKGDLKVCSCTINPGVIFTIPADKTLTVNENIIVGTGGKLLLQSNASLMQTNTNTDAYTGDFKSFVVERNTAPVRRYDFTYWSTPVTSLPGFTLHDLSPDTLVDKFFSYNPSTGWVYNNYGTEVMAPGSGYNVRAPQTFDINTPAIYKAIFTGKPNNGDIPITIVGNKYNLVGNPYPSALDATQFIKINHNLGSDVGALYFWTHNTSPASTGTGTYAYSSADYAVYSLTGSTATSNGATSAQGNKIAPTGKIATGQAFFMKPSATTIKAVFTNDMRVGANNNQFFKTTDSEDTDKNRLWLNMTNSQGSFKQVLIGYVDGATNDWDFNYDGPTISGNSFVDFYSINDTKKLTVQGRALPFEKSDLVPLGYVTKIEGNFTIAIDHADGFFNTQAVYLEDKKTGTITDLRAGDYTFTTAIGTFTDRFVLRYTNKTLGTGDFENVENGLLISVKDKIIKVTSAKEEIKDVAIFDISGKVLYDKKKIGTTELQISNLQAENQVLLIKVTLVNGNITTKKILF